MYLAFRLFTSDPGLPNIWYELFASDLGTLVCERDLASNAGEAQKIAVETPSLDHRREFAMSLDATGWVPALCHGMSENSRDTRCRRILIRLLTI